MHGLEFHIYMLAIVLSSPFALQLSARLVRWKNRRSRRLASFKTRNTPLVPSHVESVNMIDLDVLGKGKTSETVVEAWRNYVLRLSKGPPTDAGTARTNELSIESPCAMGDSEYSDLQTTAYGPIRYALFEQDQELVRDLVKDLTAIPKTDTEQPRPEGAAEPPLG